MNWQLADSATCAGEDQAVRVNHLESDARPFICAVNIENLFSFNQTPSGGDRVQELAILEFARDGFLC